MAVVQADSRAGADGRSAEPIVVVSADTHIGPVLETQLRQYCPRRYLDAFDELVRAHQPIRDHVKAMFPDLVATDGHHDVHARLRDMDADGIAAEVIFHGSQNSEPIPFIESGITGGMHGADRDLAAVGARIYNRWLADVCSVEPARHVGLAQLPMWDIDAAIRELEWAAANGLRGVNFAAPRPGIPPYESPDWEPFWSACEDTGIVLGQHGGAGNPLSSGPTAQLIYIAEASTLSRVSPVNRLVYAGVFERHPKLRLVLTELTGTWWPTVMNELDSVYLLLRDRIDDPLRRLPSEYCSDHYFVGASFHSRMEAEHAVEHGYDTNVLWGSDYPHVEGTFKVPEESDEAPLTHLAMRNTYAGLPPERVRAMLGENAIRVYGLDADALREVAARINAPTVDELAVPLDAIPPRGHRLSFRDFGPWY